MQITTESKTTLLQGGTIITANAAGDIFPDAALLVKDGRIANILKGTVDPRSIDAAEVINASGFVIAPGFIQTHVHLCQTLFRGLADDLELLDWLQKKIFPLEAAHNNRSMYCSAMLGIAELVRCGTTTILDMGSVHEEEEVIRAIGETGYRAFVGKAMMDINGVFPKLKEPTGVSLRTTRELAERWHDSYNGRIKYAAAPRFVLSCTDALMREAYGMMGDFKGALFHTHASENRREIQAVRERCKMGNVEFLHHLGVLSNRSCLAHCIYVSEDEIGMLRSTNTNVSHCPSSNLKLGSGIAAIPHLMSKGINVALGADGAPCNNTLDIFREMRLASLIQKPIHGPIAMPAQTVFEMATINGARALGLEQEIGSIEVGKKADIVLLNLDHIWNPVAAGNDLYSSIVYSAGPENVDSVMIDGRWLYRGRVFARIDQEELLAESRTELKNLLHRVEG